MKTVFNNHELPHIWASQSQPFGQANSMSFSGDTLYSYREPIARILPGGYVAHTTRKWSITTTSHQSAARSATSHLKAIFLRDVVTDPKSQVSSVRECVHHMMIDASRSRAPKRDRLRAEALRLAENFNLYAQIMKSRVRVNISTIEKTDLDHLKKVADRADELERARRVREANKRAKQAAEAIKEVVRLWRSEGKDNYLLRHEPTMLFLDRENGVVRTSRGASVPMEAASNLWPIISRTKRKGSDLCVEVSVGRYTLTLVKGDGSIVVGCHIIPFSELEEMAKQLGWFDSLAREVA